ncbi:MAG: Aminopeptidase N-like protein [Bryobacterales bacterium]|nr:Aminopeptidase N-like protein [Bryobacterales bacterium]
MTRHQFCLIAAFSLSPAFAQQPGSDPDYRKLRDAQVSESVPVENVVIRRDVGVITLKRGTVSFGPAVQGRVTGAVFVGDGTFALTPAISFERDHIKMAIGSDSVAETFERAIFFFTDNGYQELKGTSQAQAVPPSAADTWREMRQHLRAGGEFNLDAEILADLYNPKQPGFFTAYMRGKKYSDLRFFFRPRGVFQDLGPEEVGLTYEEAGKPEAGIWYLAHASAEYSSGTSLSAGRSAEEKRVVDVESYRIQSEIAKNEHLTAKTSLTFRCVAEGDRVIDLDLLPSLRAKTVRAEGHDIPFIQEDRKGDGTFHVVMPEPMVKDRTYELEIEYAGDQVIHNAGGGNFSVRARTSWYPSNPFPDQAKFDLTYKVPRQYTLVSVGTPMRQSREGDFNVSQWVSDVPLAVAGFNYGAFKKKEAKIEKLSYTLEGYAVNDLPDDLKPAADAIGGMTPSRLIDRTLAQTDVAMRIYDQWFGHAPYGRIAITQQKRRAEKEANIQSRHWPRLRSMANSFASDRGRPTA